MVLKLSSPSNGISCPSRFQLADEENRGGFPSPKKLSAAAAAAAAAAGGDRPKDNGDEHTGKRVPGVVARLMGLESLPECNYGSEGKESPQHPKMSSVSRH